MIFVITHRESVEIENGNPVFIEHGFLVTGPRLDESGRVTNEMGLLFFTSRENAETFLALIPKPEYVIATFRDNEHLRSCLKYYADGQCKWMIRNRFTDEFVIRIEDILQSPDPK